jgi:hypothetical protein
MKTCGTRVKGLGLSSEERRGEAGNLLLVEVADDGQRRVRRAVRLWARGVFSDRVETRLVPPRHGDSSGVRGPPACGPSTRSNREPLAPSDQRDLSDLDDGVALSSGTSAAFQTEPVLNRDSTPSA